MAWLERWQRLMKQEGSPLAKVARCALRGFQATLEEAMRESPHDPGESLLRECLAEIETWSPQAAKEGAAVSDPFASALVPAAGGSLGGGSLGFSPPLPPAGWGTRPKLEPLAQSSGGKESASWSQEADGEDPFTSGEGEETEKRFGEFQRLVVGLKEKVGGVEIASLEGKEGQEFWQAIQAWGWRLPEEGVSKWKERVAGLAAQARLHVERSEARAKRGPYEMEVFPGLESPSFPGLRFSRTGVLHPAIASCLEGVVFQASDLGEWGALASLLLTWVEDDPFLHHALEVVHRFQPILVASQREMVRKELLRRFQRVCEEAFPSGEGFHARWEIDEVLHSLLYLPIPGSKSEWSRLRKYGRELLYQAKREMDQERPGEIKLQSFPEDYRTLHKLQSTRNDLPLSQGGNAGQVLAELRLWLKVVDRVYPGRVVYHS